MDLYSRLRVNAGSAGRLAGVLWAWAPSSLINVGREEAGEPIIRRMLDLLRDSNPDDVTRILRARGEGTLGGILYAQEYAAEALSLQESARNTFLDLRSRNAAIRAWRTQLNSASNVWSTPWFTRAIWTGVNAYMGMARQQEPATKDKACRTLANLLDWTAVVYSSSKVPA